MKNNRTFLEKLLDGAEVEWKPLKDVAEYIRGVTYNKANESTNNIGYKVLRANNITLSDNTLNFDDIKVIKFDTKVKSSQMLYKNDILISAASGSREHVGKVAFIYQDIDYYFGGFMGVIRCNNKINSRYLFHIFTSYIFQNYLNEVLNSSTINNLNSKIMDSFKLPIPPLSVQTKIVKILDALTALTSELTSELILRRKQYEYYREKLLSEEELGKVGFEWKPLGEVTNIKTGQAVSKYSISQNPGIYPVINSGREPLGFINEWNTENDPIGITTRGAGVGSITWQEGKYFRGNLNYSVTVKSDYKLNIRFLYHILLHFQKEIHNLCSFTGIPALNASELKKLEISIPAIEEQQRIVSILDKFETLTNSITEGLPLAIEQSQKRYEYYRELLLNFS